MKKNTLQDFARVEIPEWRLTIMGIAVHQKGDARWAQLPARPCLDDAGKLMMDTAKPDKPGYAKIISFMDRDTADRFSDAVCQAVDEYKWKGK